MPVCSIFQEEVVDSFLATHRSSKKHPLWTLLRVEQDATFESAPWFEFHLWWVVALQLFVKIRLVAVFLAVERNRRCLTKPALCCAHSKLREVHLTMAALGVWSEHERGDFGSEDARA